MGRINLGALRLHGGLTATPAYDLIDGKNTDKILTLFNMSKTFSSRQRLVN